MRLRATPSSGQALIAGALAEQAVRDAAVLRGIDPDLLVAQARDVGRAHALTFAEACDRVRRLAHQRRV